MDRLLKELVTQAVEEMLDRKKEPIGMISEDLRKEYYKWREEKEDMEAEITFRLDRMRKKIEKEIALEFNDKVDANEAHKKYLWSQIRAELNIPEEVDELNIDIKTGVISKWVTNSAEKNKKH